MTSFAKTAAAATLAATLIGVATFHGSTAYAQDAGPSGDQIAALTLSTSAILDQHIKAPAALSGQVATLNGDVEGQVFAATASVQAQLTAMTQAPTSVLEQRIAALNEGTSRTSAPITLARLD